MRMTDWKRLAEQECYRYRDNLAYVQGVLDAGSTAGERMYRCAKWVLAVEYAKEYLEKYAPLKARFFNELYGIDKPLRRRCEKKSITALSLSLHTDRSTLYKWKSEALTLVVLGAVQAGALQPYGGGASNP